MYLHSVVDFFSLRLRILAMPELQSGLSFQPVVWVLVNTASNSSVGQAGLSRVAPAVHQMSKRFISLHMNLVLHLSRAILQPESLMMILSTTLSFYPSAQTKESEIERNKLPVKDWVFHLLVNSCPCCFICLMPMQVIYADKPEYATPPFTYVDKINHFIYDQDEQKLNHSLDANCGHGFISLEMERTCN